METGKTESRRNRGTKNSLKSRIVWVRVLTSTTGKSEALRLKVKSESAKWLMGWKVNVAGDETECTLKTQTLRLIDKRAIVKVTELFEDRKYGGYYAKGKNPNNRRAKS